MVQPRPAGARVSRVPAAPLPPPRLRRIGGEAPSVGSHVWVCTSAISASPVSRSSTDSALPVARVGWGARHRIRSRTGGPALSAALTECRRRAKCRRWGARNPARRGTFQEAPLGEQRSQFQTEFVWLACPRPAPGPRLACRESAWDSRATQLRADFPHQNGRRISRSPAGPARREAPRGRGRRGAGPAPVTTPTSTALSRRLPRPRRSLLGAAMASIRARKWRGLWTSSRMVRRCPRVLPSGGASIETRTSALGAARSSQHSRASTTAALAVACSATPARAGSRVFPSWVMMTPCACVATASTKARA